MGLLSLVFVAVLVAFGPFFGGEKFAVTEEQVDGKERVCVLAWIFACAHSWVYSRESA